MRNHEPECSRCSGRSHATNRVEQTSVTRGPGHYALWTALLCEDCAEKLRMLAACREVPAPASPTAQAGEWTQEDENRAFDLACAGRKVLEADASGSVALVTMRSREFCAAIARVAPGFVAPIRLPESSTNSFDGAMLYREDVAAALRAHGLKVSP